MPHCLKIVAETVLVATKEVNTRTFAEYPMFFTTGSATRMNVMLVIMVKVPKIILPDLDNIDHSTTTGRGMRMVQLKVMLNPKAALFSTTIK